MPEIPAFVRQDAGLLYPNVLYNRPVTRQGAGRLLIAGGHSGDFSLPTSLHQLAMAAGAGECQVVLPDQLRGILGGTPDTVFVPSSPSGSLGSEALDRLLNLAENTDGVALGASLSNNSHTSILIERFLQETGQPVTLFADALVALQHNVRQFTDNPNALVILTMPEVFKLAGQLRIPISIRQGGGLINKLEIIRDLAAGSRCQYVVYGTEIIVAAGEQLIVTPVNYRLSLVPAAYYAVLTVSWLQNLNRRPEGLATGAFILREASANLGDTERPSTTQLASAISKLYQQD